MQTWIIIISQPKSLFHPQSLGSACQRHIVLVTDSQVLDRSTLPALRGQLLEIVACTAWGGGRAFDLKQCSSQSPNLVSANSWPIYFQIRVLSSPKGHSPTLTAVVRIKDCVDNVSLTMRSFHQVWFMLAGLITGNKPCSEVRESWVSTQQSLYFLEYLV